MSQSKLMTFDGVRHLDTGAESFASLLASGALDSQKARYLDLLRRTPEGISDAKAAAILCFRSRETAGARRHDLSGEFRAAHSALVAEHGELIVEVGVEFDDVTGMRVKLWGLNPLIDSRFL